MITIHCGLHKTGTSSIQLALTLHRSRSRPITVPAPGDRQSDEWWRSRLRTLPSRSIVSDENILGSPFDGYARADERVRLIDESLLGRDFRFVVYFRPQLPWLQSVYLQGVQQGMADTPEAFLSRVTTSPGTRWHSLLQLLRSSAASSVIVRAYLPTRDIVGDFFAQVGLGAPPAVVAGGFRENPSVMAVHAPILRALNSGAHTGREEALRQLFQGILREGAPRGLSSFPVILQESCLQLFRDDWVALSEAVVSVDVTEAEVFRSQLSSWDEGVSPFAGEVITDPLVAAEAVRSLGILASAASSSRKQGDAMARARRALANPTAFAAAVRRRTLGRQR